MNLFYGVQPVLLQPLVELRLHHVMPPPHIRQARCRGVR